MSSVLFLQQDIKLHLSKNFIKAQITNRLAVYRKLKSCFFFLVEGQRDSIVGRALPLHTPDLDCQHTQQRTDNHWMWPKNQKTKGVGMGCVCVYIFQVLRVIFVVFSVFVPCSTVLRTYSLLCS